MTEQRYTRQTRAALSHARRYAAGAGDQNVAPVHLFWGLLDVPRSAGGWMLGDLGSDLGMIPNTAGRERFLEGSSRSEDLTMGEAALRVMRIAEETARGSGQEFVNTGHVLLGLILEGANPVAQTLAQQGVTGEDIRRVLRTSPTTDEDESFENRPQPKRKTSFQISVEATATVSYESRTDASPEEALAIVADLDSVPAEFVVELMAALDAVHRAQGGGGLKIDSEQVGAAADSAVVV